MWKSVWRSTGSDSSAILACLGRCVEAHPRPRIASISCFGWVGGQCGGLGRTFELDHTFNPFHALGVALLFAACQNLPSTKPASAAVERPGHAFAKASCSGCHAIGPSGVSSRSNAPPFADIANRDGLTAETLSFWLRGAHNYPSEMDFQLGERDVQAVVAYMLTLRDPNYRRLPD
jgi:mono/diheme cytochrome c family protein